MPRIIMMTQMRVSLILLFIWLPLRGVAQPFHFSVEHITKADGLSNTEITSIVQDRQGFIWIGTRFGLNKYDGYSVKVYQTISGDTTSLCDNNITTMLVDSRGDLWIGTENNGLSVYDRAKDRFVNYSFDRMNIRSLSADYVTSIKEDSQGNIWVGTLMGLNKFIPETKSFQRHLRTLTVMVEEATISKLAAQKLPPSLIQYLKKLTWKTVEYSKMLEDLRAAFPAMPMNSLMRQILLASRLENSGVDIKALDTDNADNIWLGFQNDSIGQFNPKQNSLRTFRINKTDKHPNISLLSLCWQRNKLWVGTKDHGLIQFDPQQKTFHRYDLVGGARLIKSMMNDAQGNLWIGDDEGLSVRNEKSNQFHRIEGLEYDNKLLSADVSAILEDVQGNLWVASFQGGVNLLKKNQSFNHDKFYDDVISPSGSKSVSAVREDSQGNLWVGYFTSGIDLFLKDSEEKISFSPFKECALGKGSVFSIFEDSRKNIWVTTYEGGLQRYDKHRQRFVSFPFKSEKNIADVRGICEDKAGNLWIVSPGNGVGKFNYANNTFSFYKADYMHTSNSLASDWVNTIFCDQAGRIWVGSVDGVSVLDPAVGHFVSYNTGNSNLSHNKVLVITQDKKGTLWIGTENGLNQFDEKNRSFKSFTIKDGLINNFIAGLALDSMGNLWISTYNGLSKLDVDTYDIKNYSNNNGLPATEFSIGASSNGKNDRIYFGAKSGLISFYPAKIQRNLMPPTVVITDFKLFNKSVPIGGEGKFTLEKHISETKTISLPYDQNVISFEFTAINYIDPKQNIYAYMLEGFEKDWNYVGTQRSATYTNLDPGTYTFHVKAANSEGVMSPVGALLEITIKPPLWWTPLAKVAYVLILIITLYFVRRAFIARIRLRNKVELDEMKLRFFANISHELRTPLTLILGPLQQLNGSGKLSREDQSELLQIMNCNGQRLLTLVNQLMNIYEIDAGVMKLKVSEGNIISLCETVYQTFRYTAAKRNIHYTLESSTGGIVGFFDADKVDKILYNIIGNAFKYSPDDSSITIRITVVEHQDLKVVPSHLVRKTHRDTKFIKIAVVDTGIGISEEYEQKIFERFFRIADTSVETGTGIGLSLAQQMARIHKGDITIRSKAGAGSEFTIWLPLSLSSYEKSELAMAMDYREKTERLTDNPQTKDVYKTDVQPENEESLPVVMIIEDSEDIRHYIRRSFRDSFHIVEADSGEQGLVEIMEVIPDIIISDIMLPGMSGLELCAKIKKDQRTSHIPVILLTARASESYQLQGLEEGAEDYVTKPFNVAVLAAKIRNILAYRKRLKMVLQLELQTQPKNTVASSADDIFLKKAIDVVEKHLEDIEFDVEMFCHELGMSHTNLYRKLQGIIGLSANQLIKNIRLKKAAALLESQTLTVNEIAYAVGFRDPKYFSKSFRKQFGVLPSDYNKSAELTPPKAEKSI